jgi:NAD(P)-dependent dehydrogenase (short-subunit alcohol dehydrogenase family)
MDTTAEEWDRVDGGSQLDAARDHGSQAIRVNAIAARTVWTPMVVVDGGLTLTTR